MYGVSGENEVPLSAAEKKLSPAADPTPAERANMKLVTEFCEAFSADDVDRIMSFMADPCWYRVTEAMEPTKGFAAVTNQITGLVNVADRFEVLDTFARGPMVFNERIDHFAPGFFMRCLSHQAAGSPYRLQEILNRLTRIPSSRLRPRGGSRARAAQSLRPIQMRDHFTDQPCQPHFRKSCPDGNRNPTEFLRPSPRWRPGSRELLDADPEYDRRRALARFPLIYDRLVGGTDSTREFCLRASSMMPRKLQSKKPQELPEKRVGK